MIIIQKPHSFIAPITNSSSEVFVCNTQQTLDFIKQYLTEALAEIEDDVGTYDECFGTITVLETDADIDGFVESILMHYGSEDFGLPEVPDHFKINDKFRSELKYPWEDNKEHNQKVYKKQNDHFEQKQRAWKKKNIVQAGKVLRGRIIIPSVSDNTIPYELFNKICEDLNGVHYHLG